MERQIAPLTSLRGIAAIMVVVLHFAYYILPKMGQILSSSTAVVRNGYLWVDFFFILSGLIMTHVYGKYFGAGVNINNYRSYLASRFARIYPLHVAIILLFVGLELAKIYLFNLPGFTGKFNFTALFASTVLLQAFDLSCPPLFWCDTYWNEPAWSISVEFVIYFIFPYLLFYLAKIHHKFNLAIYICTLVAIFLLIRFTRGNLDEIIGLPSIARCGLECLLGIITYKVYQRGGYQNYINLNLLALGSAMWIVAVLHTWSLHGRSFHDLSILPAFSLLILAVSTQQNTWATRLLNSRLMVYLGTISYSIYLVHWFLGQLLITIWQSKFQLAFGSDFNPDQVWLAFGIFGSITILTASFTYKFIEVPMRDLIKSKISARSPI